MEWSRESFVFVIIKCLFSYHCVWKKTGLHEHLPFCFRLRLRFTCSWIRWAKIYMFFSWRFFASISITFSHFCIWYSGLLRRLLLISPFFFFKHALFGLLVSKASRAFLKSFWLEEKSLVFTEFIFQFLPLRSFKSRLIQFNYLGLIWIQGLKWAPAWAGIALWTVKNNLFLTVDG